MVSPWVPPKMRVPSDSFHRCRGLLQRSHPLLGCVPYSITLLKTLAMIEVQNLTKAFTLRTMRLDYELFNQQLGILGEEESEVFQQFIRGEKDLQAIAEDKGIVYESAQQRIHRAKRKIKVQMVGFLDGNIGGM